MRQANRELRHASSGGDLGTVRTLINRGADLHTLNDYPLRHASQNGHVEVVRLLLDNGADIHAEDNYALRHASQDGHVEVVRLLLDRGSDIHVVDDYALRHASENGHVEVVKLLISKGAYIPKVDSIITKNFYQWILEIVIPVGFKRTETMGKVEKRIIEHKRWKDSIRYSGYSDITIVGL